MDKTRHFAGGKLVIASHNAGKVREIDALLAPYGVEVISAGQLGLAEPIEDGATFLENASLKARAAATASGLPSLADDSGLAVTALGGDPGIYSARWAGPTKDFGIAMQKVEDALAGAADRSAEFVSALALAWPDGLVEQAEGRISGQLVWPGRGTNGFGYDPIFVPTGHQMTFGEMEHDAKEAISHRSVAFKKLVGMCFSGDGG
ncbi:MAG: RdgB/HAM1 family non-canonical purine NTP pyrophosphatase [Rhodospirillales bacterium]|nr:RdgB/HAM1 family non-canonical purine NTP pyrophosphatase [Rhodospirillales bacterium]